MRNFKGTRDIAGESMRFRQYVVRVIKETFELFGFEELETPIIERSETLLGKYGEEAEHLLFMLAKPHEDGGLRYDHTVPLARFAATNWQNLAKPFKRYAIGPVFRGENTQAGRYRQFYQCDFDTLGSDSTLVDAEIAAITYTVFKKLGLEGKFVIQVNDRRLLNAIFSEVTLGGRYLPDAILRTWDKLDKISLDEAFEYFDKEAKALGANAEEIRRTLYPLTKELLELKGSFFRETLDELKKKFVRESAQKALDAIEKMFNEMIALGVDESHLSFNPLLARGLSYYTGPIFETIVTEHNLGSLSGGGRYDNLIADMGGPNVPASGSSFGLDRLIDVLTKLNLETSNIPKGKRVYVAMFEKADDNLIQKTLLLAKRLRENNIPAEVHPDTFTKLSKQIETAVKKNTSYFAVIGPEEVKNSMIKVKDLSTREEKEVTSDSIFEFIK